jgi:hypothetical protein
MRCLCVPPLIKDRATKRGVRGLQIGNGSTTVIGQLYMFRTSSNRGKFFCSPGNNSFLNSSSDPLFSDMVNLVIHDFLLANKCGSLITLHFLLQSYTVLYFLIICIFYDGKRFLNYGNCQQQLLLAEDLSLLTT